MSINNQTFNQLQKLFPGAEIEPKWTVSDCIHTGPLLAMYLLLGAKVCPSPNGRTTHTSMIIDDKETVMRNEDFECCQRLATNFIEGFLDRKTYHCKDRDEMWRLFSAKPSLIVDAIRWMQDDALVAYDVPAHLIRLFWTLPDNGACGHYRAERPFVYLHSNYKDEFESQLHAYVNYKALTYFETIIFSRVPQHNILAMLQNLKLEGKLMVWETDDDLLQIPDWSISSLLVPDDLKDIFDTSRKMADMIFVTNEKLKQQIGRPEITYIAPNLINMDAYTDTTDKQRSLQKEYVGFKPRRVKSTTGSDVKFFNDKGQELDKKLHEAISSDYAAIRILWFGSNTHDADLEQIVPAVAQIGAEFGIAVRFFFFGYIPPSFGSIGMLPGNTAPEMNVHQQHAHYMEFIPAVSLKNFPEMLRRIEPDIALCPLAKHPFNECKSNIKPLEVGAMGVPSIATDIGPYQFIHHRVDGLKVEHSDDKTVMTARWVQAMQQLITNRQFRMELGKNMQRRVREEYSWQTDSPNRRLWDKLFADIKTEVLARREKKSLRIGPMFHTNELAPMGPYSAKMSEMQEMATDATAEAKQTQIVTP